MQLERRSVVVVITERGTTTAVTAKRDEKTVDIEEEVDVGVAIVKEEKGEVVTFVDDELKDVAGGTDDEEIEN